MSGGGARGRGGWVVVEREGNLMVWMCWRWWLLQDFEGAEASDAGAKAWPYGLIGALVLI